MKKKPSLTDAEAAGDPHGPDPAGDAVDEEKKAAKKKDPERFECDKDKELASEEADEEELSDEEEDKKNLPPWLKKKKGDKDKKSKDKKKGKPFSANMPKIPPKVIRISGEKIFQVGVWNGDEYSSEDLEEIVRNFNALQTTFEPNMGAGHSKAVHRLFFGERALGWIKALRFESPFLKADLDVIEDVYVGELKSQKLRYKSCVIAHGFKRNGVDYGKVLMSVDLLGVSPPAVGDLGPIQLPYSDAEATTVTYSLDTLYKQEGDDTMSAEDKKKFEDSLAVMETKLSDYDTKLATFAELEKNYAALKTANEGLAVNNQMLMAKDKARDISMTSSRLVKEGKLLPKDKQLFSDLLGSMDESKELSYAEGEGEAVKLSQKELLVKFMDAQAPKVELDAELAQSNPATKANPTGQDPKVKIANKLQKFADDAGIVVKDAATAARALEIQKKEDISYYDALIKAYTEAEL